MTVFLDLQLFIDQIAARLARVLNLTGQTPKIDILSVPVIHMCLLNFLLVFQRHALIFSGLFFQSRFHSHLIFLSSHALCIFCAHAFPLVQISDFCFSFFNWIFSLFFLFSASFLDIFFSDIFLLDIYLVSNLPSPAFSFSRFFLFFLPLTFYSPRSCRVNYEWVFTFCQVVLSGSCHSLNNLCASESI